MEISKNIEYNAYFRILRCAKRIHVFLYKEHLYKELEAEKGYKNKEFLRLKEFKSKKH